MLSHRWGRVGEERPLQNAFKGPMNLQDAKADFQSKFKDKTKNEWSRRDDFKAVNGKYTLIERDYGSEPPKPTPSASAEPSKQIESKLDKRVQDFVSLIADIRMMERTMREIGFDPAKMPLGARHTAHARRTQTAARESAVAVCSCARARRAAGLARGPPQAS